MTLRAQKLNSKPASKLRRRSPQTSFFKRGKNDYGGSLRNTRQGRKGARPLATKSTMHLVLRSNQAKGVWSFANQKHDKNIRRIIEKFAFVYGVKVLSIANAFNHLHLEIKLSNRFAYAPFIRAITGAIVMSVTARTRWSSISVSDGTHRVSGEDGRSKKFWDHRPFTRITNSFKDFLNLKDYVRMNEIESDGFKREAARQMVQVERMLERSD